MLPLSTLSISAVIVTVSNDLKLSRVVPGTSSDAAGMLYESRPYDGSDVNASSSIK